MANLYSIVFIFSTSTKVDNLANTYMAMTVNDSFFTLIATLSE